MPQAHRTPGTKTSNAAVVLSGIQEIRQEAGAAEMPGAGDMVRAARPIDT
jgi:hypothetical protein